MTAFRLRDFLKAETRTAHERVDHQFAAFPLGQEHGVRQFLAAQAGALRPLEAALEGASCGGVLALLPDWPARRRAPLLEAFRGSVPSLEIDPLRGAAQMLGVAYVLEGSRLGARLLFRRLQDHSSRLGRIAAAFLSHGQGQQHWPAFVAVLDRFGGEASCAESLAAAEAAFGAFERSALQIGDLAREEGNGNFAPGPAGRTAFPSIPTRHSV